MMVAWRGVSVFWLGFYVCYTFLSFPSLFVGGRQKLLHFHGLVGWLVLLSWAIEEGNRGRLRSGDIEEIMEQNMKLAVGPHVNYVCVSCRHMSSRKRRQGISPARPGHTYHLKPVVGFI